MNNKYDREPTHQEWRDAGYEMTADGFWMEREHFTDDEIAMLSENPEPNIKLILLLSGETLLAEFVSYEGRLNTYTLRDPKITMVQSSSGDGETVQTTIAFSDWMPLSKTRDFDVSKSYIVNISDPLDSLVQSYINNTNG